MDPIEAIVYCLGFIDPVPEDGEFHSQTAYDKNGDAHWLAWRVAHGDDASPTFCSESARPFARSLGPYHTHPPATTEAHP